MKAAADIARVLADKLPAGIVVADAESRRVEAMDIAGAAAIPAAIVRPRHTSDVLRLVSLAAFEGLPLHPKGGGLSYTGGYAPASPRSILVDCTGLGGLEIAPDRSSVRVGAGITWGALFTALDARGLRVPSFGPLSGFGATIGGTVAQNGGFFGSARHGSVAESSVRAVDTVAGTGEVFTLTAGARIACGLAPQPVAGDCGAFGIKTTIELALIERPTDTGFASFHFHEGEAALAALLAVAELPGLGEAYVFDPVTHANLAATGFSVIEAAGIAADLAGARGSWWDRLGGLVRTARAGRAFVAELAWTLHLAFEGGADEIEAARFEAARIAAARGGEVVPDVIPRVTRSRPFRPIKALIGPAGERWLPCHGIVAAADAPRAFAAVRRVIAEADAGRPSADPRVSLLLVATAGRIIVEPQLFWADALTDYLAARVQPAQRRAHVGNPARPAGRARALALREALILALDAAGAHHYQIGRRYGAAGLPDHVAGEWRRWKARLDPDGIMNPGVLGLVAPASHDETENNSTGRIG